MSYIKITSKRQATLPKALCEELNVEPGDNLMVVRKTFEGQTFWCLQPVQGVATPWFGSLNKYAIGKSHDLDDIRESLDKHRRDD